MKHALEIICKPRTHCQTCRDREGGREWRETLAAVFELPADAPDFTCPHGVPWGFQAPPVDISCIHRGEPIGEAPCPTCGGNVMAKIVACAIHARATLFERPIEGVKACAGCTDRQPISSP